MQGGREGVGEEGRDEGRGREGGREGGKKSTDREKGGLDMVGERREVEGGREG